MMMLVFIERLLLLGNNTRIPFIQIPNYIIHTHVIIQVYFITLVLVYNENGFQYLQNGIFNNWIDNYRQHSFHYEVVGII